MKRKLFAMLALPILLASTSKSDFIKDDIDPTVNPATDFFDYANGGWVKQNPIPGDETSWGIGELVQKELYVRLLKINEEATKQKNPKGVTQQIADFWTIGMDSLAADKNGVEPLRIELNKIAAMRTKQDVMTQAAHMHTYGANVFFDEGPSQDQMNSEVEAYYMSQGGLGLPNRDYYFNTDSRTTAIRNAYPKYIRSIFELLGDKPNVAEAKAKAIIAMETRLADSSRKLEDLRDPYKNYNKYAITKLGKLSPGMEWPVHLRQMGVAHVDSVIVGQPEFYVQLDKVLATEDMQSLKDYMTLNLVRTFAGYLSKPYADANFNFYGKVITGAEVQKPRWKRVMASEEKAIGEALGQLFVKEYFNATAKARYEEIVENVRAAYKVRINKLDWMSDSTKRKAQVKLASITKKVGYPDKWKDFSSLKIDRKSYAGNMMRANEWWNNYYMSKLGKPVDRSEWDMTPQTYNAYYNPSNNEIVLPAGMFTVPGLRDNELDDAFVYGYAAASTVGHEITHGFDDEGRQYDEKGNLSNWWSKEDEAQFKKRSDVLVQQFNNIVAVDSLHLNGRASLGENLADLGGILLGIDAFKKTEVYKSGAKINGFTPMQRFFLGYAYSWMYEIRKEKMASQILTDVHVPAKFRVNGPIPNVAEFYESYNVKPGDKMYIPDAQRVHLW